MCEERIKYQTNAEGGDSILSLLDQHQVDKFHRSISNTFCQSRLGLCLVKNICEKRVDRALVEIIKTQILIMEVGCKLDPDKTPMPRLENVVGIIARIGKYESVFVCISEKPGVCGRCVKAAELAAEACCNEVRGCTELMLRITLVGGELIGGACAVDDRVFIF